MLAERALNGKSKFMSDHDSSREYQIDELLSLFPSLQFGMDVNPKLASGPRGVEYTKNLTAFDLLGVELVHGWLCDPINDKEATAVIGSKTYNELIEIVLMGSEASSAMEKLELSIQMQKARIESFEEKKQDEKCEVMQNEEWVNVSTSGNECQDENVENVDKEENNEKAHSEGQNFEKKVMIKKPVVEYLPISGDNEAMLEIEMQLDLLKSELDEFNKKYEEQSVRYRNGTIVDLFLKETSHQLTFTGLTELHKCLQENSVCVFFRNNHFSTITKFGDTLYLLVTDLGYANVLDVVWEKLDDVSGDTELANECFVCVKPRSQSEADYQLAVELSNNGTSVGATTEEQLVAAATKASIEEWNDQTQSVGMDKSATVKGIAAAHMTEEETASEALAHQLQAEENNRARYSRQVHSSPRQKTQQRKEKEGCIIA